VQLEQRLSREVIYQAFNELVVAHIDDLAEDLDEHIALQCWDIEAGRLVRTALARGFSHVDALRVLWATCKAARHDEVESPQDLSAQAACTKMFASMIDKAQGKQGGVGCSVTDVAELHFDGANTTTCNMLDVALAATWVLEWLFVDDELKGYVDPSRAVEHAAQEMTANQLIGAAPGDVSAAAQWVGQLADAFSKKPAPKKRARRAA
jgi:hypothetical protein